MKLTIQNIPFPWQQQPWQQLLCAVDQKSVPQALLLTGQKGMGKRLFAQAFAKLLLCQGDGIQRDNTELESTTTLKFACHRCKSCNLFEKGSHPDLEIITPEKEGGAIKIDQIRQTICLMNQTSQRKGYKIVLICPAEEMNRSAFNALLKMLEEPPARASLFILVSHQVSLLPATIRSRCHQLVIKAPTKIDALAWLSDAIPELDDPDFYLKLCQNAPLAVIERYQEDFAKEVKEFFSDLDLLIKREGNPVIIAKKWATMDKDTLFQMLQLWIVDVIRSAYGVNDQVAYQVDHQVNHRQPTTIFQFLDFVTEYKKLNYDQFNLNQQLCLENIFERLAM